MVHKIECRWVRTHDAGTARDAWDRAEALSNKHRALRRHLFLRDDGDRAVVVFCGQPLARELVDITGRRVAAGSGDGQRAARAGARPMLRVSMNVYDLFDSSMKILDMGLETFVQLARLRRTRGLAGWAYDVTREGTTAAGEVYYSLAPARSLGAAEFEAVRSVDLHDLAAAPPLVDPAGDVLSGVPLS